MNASNKIRVVGIGAAGLRMLECVHALNLPNALTVGIDTDIARLESAKAAKKLAMKTGVSDCGTGGQTKAAKDAAMQYIQYLAKAARHTRVLVLIGGLGGGTASIVAPILTKLADKDTAIIAVFAMPFEVEGEGKRELARKSFEFIKSRATVAICLKNDLLIDDGAASFEDAYKRANAKVAQLVELIACGFADNAFLKIDGAELQSYFYKKATFAGAAQADAGGVDAAFDEIKKSPMMRENLRAQNMLVCVKCPKKFSMGQIKDVLKAANAAFDAADKISFAVCADEACEDVKILALATPAENNADAEGESIFAREDEAEPPAPRLEAKREPRPETELEPRPAHVFANKIGESAPETEYVAPAESGAKRVAEESAETPPPVEFKPEPAADAKKQPTKEQLQFTFDERGLFENTPRNERKNIDVDIPTFSRKRIKITLL